MFMVTGGRGEDGYLDSSELLEDGPWGNNNQWILIEAKLPFIMSGSRMTTIHNQVFLFGKLKVLSIRKAKQMRHLSFFRWPY